MNTFGRLLADRAHQRTTTSRCRSLTTFALALPLLVAGCGAELATDSAIGTATTSPTHLGEVESDAIEVAGSTTSLLPDQPVDDSDSPAVVGSTGEADEVIIDDLPPYTDVLDAPEPEPLEPGSPEAAISKIENTIDEPSVGGGSGAAVLDRVQPLDQAPSGDAIGIREGRRINEAGESAKLDEAGALACGNVEVALTAIDEGQIEKAISRLQSASTMTADTSVAAMKPWAPILNQSATDLDVAGPSGTDASPLLAFLTTCSQGGYEL